MNPLPEPPYSADLLADYDAGVLSPEVSAHLRSHLNDDARAQRILAALAATRAELASTPPPLQEVPAAVAERLQHLVEGLGNTSA
ncbi:hypothetical protein GOHSU_24_00360 [Gordonia hirsuta DSM 44140 = NBRC 16056]|uniref:Anti-sigma factor n=1 Tax=Gordonia hirsuta DSM 44140 = NBRC 16056 TaxID=1121927 RepID=L7LCE2_9ACTN|nr:hypothetical protein [Gordonia hirsuta]GAC57747.1 hypothetical protein GOHSU_24_00360 [Gordonia hirsuta DSM 44140 = NBRC 16056]